MGAGILFCSLLNTDPPRRVTHTSISCGRSANSRASAKKMQCSPSLGAARKKRLPVACAPSRPTLRLWRLPRRTRCEPALVLARKCIRLRTRTRQFLHGLPRLTSRLNRCNFLSRSMLVLIHHLQWWRMLVVLQLLVLMLISLQWQLLPNATNRLQAMQLFLLVGMPRLQLATQLETRVIWRRHICCSCTSSTWMLRGADGGSTRSICTNTWLLSWRAGFQCAHRTQRTERSC